MCCLLFDISVENRQWNRIQTWSLEHTTSETSIDVNWCLAQSQSKDSLTLDAQNSRVSQSHHKSYQYEHICICVCVCVVHAVPVHFSTKVLDHLRCMNRVDFAIQTSSKWPLLGLLHLSINHQFQVSCLISFVKNGKSLFRRLTCLNIWAIFFNHGPVWTLKYGKIIFLMVFLSFLINIISDN